LEPPAGLVVFFNQKMPAADYAAGIFQKQAG